MFAKCRQDEQTVIRMREREMGGRGVVLPFILKSKTSDEIS
jgi:hypothetical protein